MMKEFIDKLISRLEEREAELKTITAECKPTKEIKDKNYGYYTAMNHAKEIVNQLAEEYKQQYNDQDLMVVESLPSLYPMMQPFEEEALVRVVERAKYNNGWILCSEKLPETNESVFCWAKSTARGGDVCFVGSCHNGFWFLQSSADTHSFPGQYVIIAWKPIAPYQPKGE